MNWQRTQIVLDNTAILLGRSDKQIAQQLEKDRSSLLVLHKKLHRMRACSLIPATALYCSKFTKLLQLSIRDLNLKAMGRAQTAWKAGTILAQAELIKSKLDLVLRRDRLLKLYVTHCPFCFEADGWNLTALNQVKSSVLDQTEKKLSASVSLVRELTGNWTYRLWSR